MRKRLKGVLSIILAILIFWSILITAPISANAYTSHTQAEAVQWAKDQVGKGLDRDGAYGVQCVDLIMYYYEYLGNSRVAGNGSDYSHNALPAGWQRIQYYNGFVAQPGDIAVWTYTTSSVGHVAIVVSADANTMNVIDQRGAGHTNAGYSSYRYSYGTFWGVIRPDFKQAVPSVTNAWISTDKTIVLKGESVQFNFGAENASWYNLQIEKSDQVWNHSDRVTSGITFDFNETGSYIAYIGAYNEGSSMHTQQITFKVFDPRDVGEDFYAHIYNAKGTFRAGADNSDNVYLQSKNDNQDQIWHFERNSDRSYRITNVGQNKCLDIDGENSAFADNIYLAEPSDSDSQKWYLRQIDKGFVFIPKSNKEAAMDIYDGTLANGTNIRLWSWNDANAQTFCIDYIDLTPTAEQTYNGHTYKYFAITTTWNQAYKLCEGMGGHLVTISDKEENDFVYELAASQSQQNVWLGGTDYFSEGNWFWVNGESFAYTNWGENQPDNNLNIENFLQMSVTDNPNHTWNDIMHQDEYNHTSFGFICEFDNDVTETDYLPYRTTYYENLKYEFYSANVTWQTAKQICEKKGGHLVIIDDEYENQFIKNIGHSDMWIGVTDCAEESVWKTVNGEPIIYSNWAEGEPNNTFMIEDYATIYEDGTWNDTKGFNKYGFVCEYEDKFTELKPTVTQTFNGHKYEYYNIDTQWNQAYNLCEKLGGHLVTVTSQEENSFILRLVNSVENNSGYLWLGATDFAREGSFYWVNNEPFNYTNWQVGQPDNNSEQEHYAHLFISGDDAGQWNDLMIYDEYGHTKCSFVCEYDSDVDSSQYTPALKVENSNSVYEIYNDSLDWQTAKKICEAKGGHLAVIENADEQAFIEKTLEDAEKEKYWIGFTDLENEGEWKWINGSTFEYTNWLEGEPNNGSGMEDYTSFRIADGKWWDLKGFSCTYHSMGFICEYDKEKSSDTDTDVTSNTDTDTDFKTDTDKDTNSDTEVNPNTDTDSETDIIPNTDNDIDNVGIIGDIDGNGKITTVDSMLILRYTIGLVNFDEAQKKRADVDVNGRITSVDSLQVLRYCIGLSSNGNIGQQIK